MDRSEITVLTNEYGAAIARELTLVRIAERARIHVLNATEIDGKNAEARKLQQEIALVASAEYQSALAGADNAGAIRKECEAEIGLLKAWLYSQARIG